MAPLQCLGPDGLVDNWTSGPTPRLSPDQLAEFDKIAEAGLNHEVAASAADRPQARHTDKFGVEFHGQLNAVRCKRSGSVFAAPSPQEMRSAQS